MKKNHFFVFIAFYVLVIVSVLGVMDAQAVTKEFYCAPTPFDHCRDPRTGSLKSGSCLENKVNCNGQCDDGLEPYSCECERASGPGIGGITCHCQCPWCGDGIKNGNEECDGFGSGGCESWQGYCKSDCTCPKCEGDGRSCNGPCENSEERCLPNSYGTDCVCRSPKCEEIVNGDETRCESASGCTGYGSKCVYDKYSGGCECVVGCSDRFNGSGVSASLCGDEPTLCPPGEDGLKQFCIVDDEDDRRCKCIPDCNSCDGFAIGHKRCIDGDPSVQPEKCERLVYSNGLIECKFNRQFSCVPGVCVDDGNGDTRCENKCTECGNGLNVNDTQCVGDQVFVCNWEEPNNCVDRLVEDCPTQGQVCQNTSSTTAECQDPPSGGSSSGMPDPNTAGCGNGIIEGSEVCDMSEGCSNGDYCNDDCTGCSPMPDPNTAGCGNGIIEGSEVCDMSEGCSNGDYCNDDCTGCSPMPTPDSTFN